MTIITSTAELKQLCDQFSSEEFVTVDTEFLRDKTYYPKLCLIQIAAPASEPYGIDPLAEGMDLTPLFELFQNQKVIKVFHSAKQDLEIILALSNQIPVPLFDTQVAAMVCGFGEAASYATLVEKLAGAHIDKSSRFTDWSQRPLSQKQVEYALSDVTYLRDVYLKLKNKLVETKREHWVDEEMSTLLSPETYRTDPEQVWKKIRSRTHSKPFLYMVKELAKWRELKSQALDIPRTHLMKDPVLLQLAASAPKNYEKLSKVRGIGRAAEKQLAAEILDVINHVLDTPKDQIPELQKPKERADTSRHKAILDLLRVLLKAKATEHDVAEKLLASGDDIAQLATGDVKDLACGHGWRYEVFGKDALELLSGKVGLAVKKGKIVFCKLS